MPNLNRVFLIGHLGADPETKQAGETTVTENGVVPTGMSGSLASWRKNAPVSAA